ncbi:hypothetical protein SDC9_82899 [bioreactor metagenome]|uniref:FlgN protein n=1 Tax=bioreactor metagenome TaxID=1076179 RepID=A0A644ZEK1_9ZZZZ
MDKAGEYAQNLLHVLQEEFQLTGDLIGFAREKEQLLARADVKSLNDLLTTEEETVIALREKEEERNRNVMEFADVLGVSPVGLTIRQLAEWTKDAELGHRLVSAGNDIAVNMRELSRHNEKVKRLLKHQVAYTEFMLNLLLSTKNQAIFYNVQGNREEKENTVSRLNYHA